MTSLPARPTTPLAVMKLFEPLNSRAKELKRQEKAKHGKAWETRVRMANGLEAAVGLAQMQMNVLQLSTMGALFGRRADKPEEMIPIDFQNSPVSRETLI